MKKILALITVLAVALTLCACAPELTPAEKLDKYITENGKQNNNETVVEFPEIEKFIEEQEFGIASSGGKTTPSQNCRFVKKEDSTYFEIVDEAVTTGGLKMERRVTLALDGKFSYSNGLVFNGQTLGVQLEGEIPMESYNKEASPVITSSKFSEGAKMTDPVKELLKNYIDLTMDCLEKALATEDIGLTLSDIGFTAYQENK